MGFWNRRPKEETPPPAPPQLRPAERHPFALIDGYVPLHEPAFDLYRAIREAVPVVDAAIRKLVRLAGGVGVTCPDKGVEAALNHFLRTVPAGWNQQGIQAFLDSYLDCLLTCGRAVGEIVPSRDGREIAAVLCGRVSDIQVREGDSPLEVVLAQKRPDGSVEDLPRQELLLFTPYHPSPENPYGVSLLRSMPFLAGVLLKIYQTLGANWVYKPDGEADPRQVKERSQLLAQRWSEAMGSTRAGSVRDFVAVGDVEIRVIGAECDIPDCQAPVRLLLEQLISQTGIPPFLLGLNWSSTERMSSQQADMLTSELDAYRRVLTPVVGKICDTWLALEGYEPGCRVEWEEITMQDEVDHANARYLTARAKKLEQELKAEQEG